MKNKIKYLIFIGLVIFAAIYFLKTEVTVEQLQRKEINDVKYIINRQDEVELLGFTSKPIIEAFDNKMLHFSAAHKKFDYENYLFDLERGQLYFEEDYASKRDYRTIEYNNSTLYKDNEVIIEDIEEENNKGFYKISKDQSKIIYYKDGCIYTYHLENDFTRKIEFDYKIENYKEFNTSIGFSPEAGYFYYIEPDTDLLNVFGADSGNLYGKKVFGKTPRWLNDDELLFINENNKIGIYKVYQDDMQYFYTTDKNILNNYYTYNNKIIFFVVENNTIQSLNIYDFNTNHLKVLDQQYKLESINLDFNNHFLIIDNKNKLVIYDLDKNLDYTIDHLEPINGDLNYLITKDGIIANQNGKIKLLNNDESIELSDKSFTVEEINIIDQSTCIIIFREGNTYNFLLKTYN